MKFKKLILNLSLGVFIALVPFFLLAQGISAERGGQGNCAPATQSTITNANGQVVVTTGGQLNCPAVTGNPPAGQPPQQYYNPTTTPTGPCPATNVILHAPVIAVYSALGGPHYILEYITPDGQHVQFDQISVNDVQVFASYYYHLHLWYAANSGHYVNGVCQGMGAGTVVNGGVCATPLPNFLLICQAGKVPTPGPPSPPTPSTPLPAGLLAHLPVTGQQGSIASRPIGRYITQLPSCNWINNDTLPTGSSTYYTETLTPPVNGISLFLRYQLTVTAGPVVWSYGDNSSASGDSGQPVQYVINNQAIPCTNSHTYKQVSNGVTVTATQHFSVSGTVSWNDGVAATTIPLALPANIANININWTGPTTPVHQIEVVPYNTPTPTPRPSP